ncbi:hypothetical protein NE237_006262 [Protea cynaroides]|uniref:Uncharacterized protein n=1 Tax=Protea cynaroides TaxID=273540 RepID=A0A9Q0KLZ8_9MAGN|nr:hypothetical protein NE237_006262 [Protea cynaroides]
MIKGSICMGTITSLNSALLEMVVGVNLSPFIEEEGDGRGTMKESILCISGEWLELHELLVVSVTWFLPSRLEENLVIGLISLLLCSLSGFSALKRITQIEIAYLFL